MYSDDVLRLISERPGLSDRQITDSLLGPGTAQQTVNQACRLLDRQGQLVRRKRPDGILGNYLANVKEKGDPLEPRVSDADTRRSFPICLLPPDLSARMREIGRFWAESSLRPRLSREVKDYWDGLIEEWVAAPDMPLAVRKTGAGVRAGYSKHMSTSREIVFADNSPAQWAFSRALQGFRYSIDDLKSELINHRIPFTFATKAAEKEKVKYKGTLSSCKIDLNSCGWKLCHIKPVGLKTRTSVEDLPIKDLEAHFRSFLRPSNHFVVPKIWSGFGEIPEVIEEIAKFDVANSSSSPRQ